MLIVLKIAPDELPGWFMGVLTGNVIKRMGFCAFF
jgi:hypothetical protein